jgi:hypothetical protein
MKITLHKTTRFGWRSLCTKQHVLDEINLLSKKNFFWWNFLNFFFWDLLFFKMKSSKLINYLVEHVVKSQVTLV